jgi:hypothetical protein
MKYYLMKYFKALDAWHLECGENSEAIKQPFVYSDIVNKCMFLFFSRSFLTIIESILGKIQIITSHQRTLWLIFFKAEKSKKKINTYECFKNTHKWQLILRKWATIVCIHICQGYLTELPVLLNPLAILLVCRILANSKFCNGPMR